MTERRTSDDHLTTAEVDRIAEEAAHRAVSRTLRELGMDTHDWSEAQKDAQWVRRARRGQESVRRGVVWGAATTFGAGLIYVVWWIVDSVKVH